MLCSARVYQRYNHSDHVNTSSLFPKKIKLMKLRLQLAKNIKINANTYTGINSSLHLTVCLRLQDLLETTVFFLCIEIVLAFSNHFFFVNTRLPDNFLQTFFFFAWLGNCGWLDGKTIFWMTLLLLSLIYQPSCIIAFFPTGLTFIQDTRSSCPWELSMRNTD